MAFFVTSEDVTPATIPMGITIKAIAYSRAAMSLRQREIARILKSPATGSLAPSRDKAERRQLRDSEAVPIHGHRGGAMLH